MKSDRQNGGVFFPQDIDLLESAFKRLCYAARIDRSDIEAGVIAAELFNQFENGCQTHNELVHAAAVSDEYRSTIAKRPLRESIKSTFLDRGDTKRTLIAESVATILPD